MLPENFLSTEKWVTGDSEPLSLGAQDTGESDIAEGKNYSGIYLREVEENGEMAMGGEIRSH